MQFIKMSEAMANNLQIPSNYKTLSGAPADVDGAPVYTSSDPSVGSILSQDDSALDADKTHFVLVELHGVLGPCTISVTADADLGDGSREMAMPPYEFEVVGDEAATGSFGATGMLIPK